MSSGEDKAVTAKPAIVRRVMAHDFLKEQVGSWGKTYRSSGMAVPYFFNRIRCQNLGRFHREIIEFIPLKQYLDSRLFGARYPLDKARRLCLGVGLKSIPWAGSSLFDNVD